MKIITVALLGTFSFGAAANDGLYVHGDIQLTKFDLPADNNWYQCAHSYQADLKETGFAFGLGYEWKYLRAEINHNSLGTGSIDHAYNQDDDSYFTCAAKGSCAMATGADQTYWKVRGESIDLLGQYPIGSFKPYAGLGLFKYRVTSHTEAWKLNSSEPRWTETIHGKGSSIIVRYGFKVDLTEKDSFTVDFKEYPDIEVRNTASKSAKSVGVGYARRF